jgi:hypothetical protein
MKALLITILSFCLPFLSVIRISTYLYTHENQPTYVSLLGAAFVGACVLVFVINPAENGLFCFPDRYHRVYQM